MPWERTSKYEPLYDHLMGLKHREWRASFRDVEAVLGFQLPTSARKHQAWWANEQHGQHSHAKAWLGAGWETWELDLAGHKVTFRRIQ